MFLGGTALYNTSETALLCKRHVKSAESPGSDKVESFSGLKEWRQFAHLLRVTLFSKVFLDRVLSSRCAVMLVLMLNAQGHLVTATSSRFSGEQGT